MSFRLRFGSLGSRLLPGYGTLVLAITLVGIGVSITRPYLSLFGANVVHMSAAELGVFMCVNGVGGILASTWLGRLSDLRVAKKFIMLVSAACSALGYGVFLVLHSYLPLLIVSTVLLGLGSSVFPQLFAYARETASRVPGVDATFATSSLRSFFSLAWVIGPLLGSYLLQVCHFSGLFAATALLFAAVFAIVVWRIERRPPAGIQGSRPIKSFAMLRDGHIVTACLSYVAVYTASSMNGLYMPLFVTKELHGSDRVVGSVVALSAGLEIPIILGLGVLSVRIGKRPLLLFGSVCGAMYYVGAWLAQKPWEMLALQLLCATFIAISVSIGMSYMQDFMPGTPGAATALYSNTNNLGQMLGSLLGGAIAQWAGYRDVYLLCTALAAISWLLLLRGKRFKAEETKALHAALSSPDAATQQRQRAVNGD
ncbi:SET family sugar efflux transporter-like MFS transporter [Alicyclobacillus sacchari]|uniref:SET family sugar efflux transporter-like MFS transporter n=2 Tax=Alicyclobacillus sacchari TaxID=392010 RepID=A0A4V3HEA2_9BACL|nr:sugar efflux transporter [Alicyclobacillus sacchari]TDY45285.1 SET family sugar efflux transporter-like MFS transporter [Alicyclobacillus sacchari]